MTVPMGEIQALSFADINASLPVTKQGASTNFLSNLDRELSTLNRKIVESDTQLRALANGQADNLHQVMIALEEARLSFQMVLQVRNRVLEAYQEILRMQV